MFNRFKNVIKFTLYQMQSENCKLYDDKRNVERKLATHFQVSI